MASHLQEVLVSYLNSIVPYCNSYFYFFIGMSACLAVGMNAAKSLAAALRKPLVGVHHMVQVLVLPETSKFQLTRASSKAMR
jgi:hypothetical protein